MLDKDDTPGYVDYKCLRCGAHWTDEVRPVCLSCGSAVIYCAVEADVREAGAFYEASLRLREQCLRVMEDGIHRRLEEALREMPGVPFELHKASFDVERGGAARLQAELDRPRCDR